MENSAENVVACNEHGEAIATFICCHLVQGERLEWFSGDIDDETSYPDAWCGKCHESYLKEGEWNEKSENAVGVGTIQLICHHCYEKIKKRCRCFIVK